MFTIGKLVPLGIFIALGIFYVDWGAFGGALTPNMSGFGQSVLLLMFAFVIGDTCRAIGTGDYVARAVEGGLAPFAVPAALFLVSAITSFSTGTSWGTWAIMIPIAIPMIDIIGLNTSLVIASVLGGGIFGDHCSPISDSTIMSSMAAGTDHIDHVRTQLPYALIVAGVTVTILLALGMIL